ncbi:DUF1634 domain-containing protein [Acidianus sulfidivorans JP7]|uniref:DUF1634 domain-containing protein n=1 Tax=Acidianus sulfidivorans JP7 TaxID=619593 RepID=A0A2U9IL50_9CREN|nr:DUF1634 domain-containing protein [Acidianus sulfidivorans JP7]
MIKQKIKTNIYVSIISIRNSINFKGAWYILNEKDLISNTLRYGVIIAAALVVIGVISFVILHYNANIYQFSSSNINLTDYTNPLTITLYGVIVLISLPIIIVFEQFIIYLAEKDKIYIGISLFVFLMLIFATTVLPRLLHT